MDRLVIREIGRAKVNLTLKVLGRRGDGYHELQSLVGFASCGDEIHYIPEGEASFVVDGPYAAAIDGANLVAKAHAVAAERFGLAAGGTVHLVKNLPVAAGIGGGSADAAAMLRALQRQRPDLSDQRSAWHTIARGIGADVPVCLHSRLSLMWGVGEQTQPLPPVAALGAILVNPGVPLATRDVFRELAAPAIAEVVPPAAIPLFRDVDELLEVVSCGANDLEEPARRLAPQIDDVLAAIAATGGCEVARMSGSGPTCFGLYRTIAAATAAAAVVARRHPHWWVLATELS